MRKLFILALVICFASCKKDPPVEPNGPGLREIQVRFKSNNNHYAIWWKDEHGKILRDSVLNLDTSIITHANTGNQWSSGADHKSPNTKLEMYVTVVNGGISNGYTSGFQTVNVSLTTP